MQIVSRQVERSLRSLGLDGNENVKITIVSKQQELPEQLQDDSARIEGAFDTENSNIYLVAENISSARIPKVLLHEVAGHLGLRKLFSGEFDRFLFSIAQTHSDEVAKIAADRNLDISNEAGLLEAAEEFVATFAENGTENTIWQRIAAAFRNFLRNIGFDLEYSDSELRSLLSRGLRNLQGSVVKDNLTTDGGVRYLAKANDNDIANLFEYAKSINLPDNHIFFKILSGQGSIFNGRNRVFLESKAVRSGLGKHILELGYATRGGVYIQEFIDNFEKAFNGERHFDKQIMEGFYVYKDSDDKPLYTFRTYEKDGKEYFESFYGHKRGEKKTKKIVASLRTSHRLLSNLVPINLQQLHNISQNPKNASPEGKKKPKRNQKNRKKRYSVANDGGFRSSDPHKEELWAKFIVKIANANYINTDAAAALLLDHGIRITPQDEQTLVAAAVIKKVEKIGRSVVFLFDVC